MHPEAMSWVRHCLTEHDLHPVRVLEFGSKNVNGSVRKLAGIAAAEVFHGVDLVPGDGVDEVCDAADYIPPSELFDLVVTTEMLEHCPHPERVIGNAARCLTDGGVFVMTAAGPGRHPHSAVDGKRLRDGEHYGNIDPDELRGWLATRFDRFLIDVQRNPADVRAIAWR